MKGSIRAPGAQVRASFWFWPVVGVLFGFLVTLGLLRVRPAKDSTLAERTFSGDTSVATSVLQTVATGSMTAASLTFSLTIVGLQLASQQFSPRLLRDFARDRLIQATIGVLVSGFVVPLTTLKGIDPERPLPVLAISFSLLLGLVAAVLLVGLVGHVVRVLRVSSMMTSVHQQTRSSALDAYPPYEQGPADVHPELPGPEGGQLVPARRSGFVRRTDPERLVEAAARHGLFVRLGMRPGDQVVSGAPLAAVWSLDGRDLDLDAVTSDLHEGIALGYERTEEQDVAFGFRLLVDLAVKAISPGINDPTTAGESLGYCADLLVLLQHRRLGSQLKCDADGVPRVELPDRDHRYYLELTCAQLRRFGRGMPEVLIALLRLLRDCAVAVRDDEQRRAVAEQVDLVEQQLEGLSPGELLPADEESVRDMVRRARLALAGDVAQAYRDRSGETRSV